MLALKVATLIGIWAISGWVSAAAAQPTTEETEAIIKRLEESGALDRAIDRGIERYINRQREAERKRQEAQAAQLAQMAKNARATDPSRDHILGNAQADVTIIEYSDYECPYCKTFFEVPRDVVKRQGGRVNLVWRHFPLTFHNPTAEREAEAAECAAVVGGEPAFWTFSEQVMHQTASNGKGIPALSGDPLLAIAQDLGLDPAAFQKCAVSGMTKIRVREDQDDGSRAGITGTPGVIIRHNKTGKTVAFAGGVPVEELEAQVEEVFKP